MDVHARSAFNHPPQICILFAIFINSNNVIISVSDDPTTKVTYTAAIWASDGLMNVFQNMDFQHVFSPQCVGIQM